MSTLERLALAAADAFGETPSMEASDEGEPWKIWLEDGYFDLQPIIRATLAKLRDDPPEAALKSLDEYASDLHEGLSAKPEDAWKAAINAILEGKD